MISEFTAGGLSSRLGRKRYDVRHHWMDPILVGGPWVLAAGAAMGGIAALGAAVGGGAGLRSPRS